MALPTPRAIAFSFSMTNVIHQIRACWRKMKISLHHADDENIYLRFLLLTGGESRSFSYGDP